MELVSSSVPPVLAAAIVLVAVVPVAGRVWRWRRRG